MAISLSQPSSERFALLKESLMQARLLLRDAALAGELIAPLIEDSGSLWDQGRGGIAQPLRTPLNRNYAAVELQFGLGNATGLNQDSLAPMRLSRTLTSASFVPTFTMASLALGEDLALAKPLTLVAPLALATPFALEAESAQDSLRLLDALSPTRGADTFKDIDGQAAEPIRSEPSSFEPSSFEPSRSEPSRFEPSSFEPSSILEAEAGADPFVISAPPLFLSPSNVTVFENQVEAIDVDAIDLDSIGDTSDILYSLTGGADASLFEIDSISGVVTFRAAPDFELPGDADANNIYNLQVTATDADGLSDIQDIAIAVADVVEAIAPEDITSEDIVSEAIASEDLDSEVSLDAVRPSLSATNVSQITQIAAGETINWTYNITNTGNVAFNSFQFVDDNGTFGVTHDDLNIVLTADGNLASNGISFIGGDRNGNQIFDVGEVWSFTSSDIAQDLSVSIDFDEALIDGAGDIITQQYNSAEFGFLEISTPLNPFGAMIFDSANPTGGDWDLLTSDNPNCAGVGNVIAQNNVLIISEDGDQLDPDDNADGGMLRFSFGEPYGVVLDAVSLLDVDATERRVTADSFLADQLITSHLALPLGDNSFQRLELQGDIANQLEVDFVHSGAVTNLEYRQIFGKTVTFMAAASGQVLNQSISSFYTNPLDSFL